LVVDDAIVVLENVIRHVENGEEPFQAALRGAREVGFTIISISIVADCGVHPHLLHARRHRPAVPRVCGGGGLVHRGVGLCVADPGADAGQPLPDRRSTTRSRQAWLVRSLRRGFDALLAGYTRMLDLALRAPPSWSLARWRRHFRGHRVAVASAIPKGFFPEEDIGQIQVTTEAAEDMSFAAHGATAGAWPPRSSATDPNVAQWSAPSTGGGGQNIGRMFVTLKPRSEREPDEDRWWKACARSCAASPGINVSCGPPRTCSLAGGQSKAQYPVHPAKRRGRRAQRLGQQAAGEAACRPAVP